MNSKNLVNEVSDKLTEALFESGYNGIKEVATQYIFGTKKLFAGQFNAASDKESIKFINIFSDNVKNSYLVGGEELVKKYIQTLIDKGVSHG